MGGHGDLFPFLLGALFLLIPIVLILTRHQQKMTMMLNGVDPNRRSIAPQNALEQEVTGLRDLVHQQTLMLEEMKRSQEEIKAALSDRQGLTERVSLTN